MSATDEEPKHTLVRCPVDCNIMGVYNCKPNGGNLSMITKFLYRWSLAWTVIMTAFMSVSAGLEVRGYSLDGTLAVWRITDDFVVPALVSLGLGLWITIIFTLTEEEISQ